MQFHPKKTSASPFATFAVIALSCFICVLASALMIALSAHTNTLAFSCIIILLFFAALIAIMLLVLFSHSKIVKKGAALAEKRAHLLKLISTLSLGILFTGTVNIAATSIAQAQFDLANHSTLPSWSFAVDQADGVPEYDLFSPVGSATYISLQVTDRIYFRHEGAPCELNVNQRTALSNGTGSIDASVRSVSFRPKDHFTDKEDARVAATKCIQSRLPAVEYVSLDRCYEVTYFDYQNTQVTCHFSIPDDGQPYLTQTTPHFHSDNNASSMTHAKVSYEQAVTSSLDCLLSNFSLTPEQSRIMF